MFTHGVFLHFVVVVFVAAVFCFFCYMQLNKQTQKQKVYLFLLTHLNKKNLLVKNNNKK